MESEKVSEEPNRMRTPRHTKTVMLLEFVVVTFLSGWIVLEYLHNVFLQDYVRTTIDSNASILQFAVPIGLTVILSSLYLQRKRSAHEAQAALKREEILRKINFIPVTRPTQQVPHQVFAIPRPARDTKFRIQKTRSRGKISRNRAGQRIPPEDDS